MGSIVTLSIRTDGFAEVAEEPQRLIDAIADGMNSVAVDSDADTFHGTLTVHQAHHYSEPRLYMVADGFSLPLDRYSLTRLLEADSAYWSSAAGLEKLRELVDVASERLVEAERLVDARRGEAARAQREAPGN